MTTAKPRILSITSSRADVGILGPVWRALRTRQGVDPAIFATGMHCPEPARSKALIAEQGIDPTAVLLGGADLGGGDGADAARAMAAIASAAGQAIEATRPDLLLAVGDRLDMIPAVTAALPFNIPIAHLHGGEITEGAVDDAVRHAISKLAHLHCVSSRFARRNLLALGEEDWRIRITGAPGLDTLRQAPTMPRTAFFERYMPSMSPECPFILATVHPETNSETPIAPFEALTDALDTHQVPTLLTAPNADPGGRDLRAKIDSFVAARSWCAFVGTLGAAGYPNALRHAALIAGNSSSGIVEAGLFACPVVNIGDRQAGRERWGGVVDTPNDGGAVSDALSAILKDADADPNRSPDHETPYGIGQSGEAIAEVLTAPLDRAGLLRKRLDPGPIGA